MPVSKRFQFNDFSKSFKALENIAAGDAVYVTHSGLIDDFQPYANNTEIQAVWVDSDAVNKMTQISSSDVSFSLVNYLLLTTTASSQNDYIDKTISSTDYTGYTVNMIINASDLSGIWEFLLSSGANAITNNVKQSITISSTGHNELVSFTVAGMTADNGTYDPAATLHIGFRNLSASASKVLRVRRLWFTKSGTTYDGIKVATSGYSGLSYRSTSRGIDIGFAPQAITSGNTGTVILHGPVCGGFTNMVAGLDYGLNDTGEASPFDGQLTFERHWWGLSHPYTSGYHYSGVALSSTELMLDRGMYFV